MEQIIGYILSIMTSIFFSIYVLPKKIVKEKTMYYTIFLTLGFLITSTILYRYRKSRIISKPKNTFWGYFNVIYLRRIFDDKLIFNCTCNYFNLFICYSTYDKKIPKQPNK